VDFVKDDHGLADQVFSRFADRVQACAAATRGTATRYVPSLSGSLDDMRAQLRIAVECGLDSAMVAPMLMGPANMLALVRAHPGVAFFAHPTLGGAARIAPDLLIGKLFRLFGADVVIFPNHGGRFGYTPQTCLRLAANARKANPRLRPAIPAPAGGMTVARTAEILDFYGPDTMLLIGGSLLAARDRLTEQTAAFTDAVARHAYRAQ
jgi:ribulose-bisphosphate carboxylase large chain